ncbi:nucleotidyltransferase [Polaribacter reichenbachii]|uniref:Nucleotidyltransferase n=1 Tax=Polaribacter reichenbachii TaxID=996801 RepID=A0A1B8U425_9FLAO|nr:sugar phosphate nucleotidyltransferase [Polaribacter reichenbachii]APZ47918.1 nucleotidyltransferase [Polaribacter reichenbachii]AUC18550.1 nucleotidyltransferase [Polaribacter reichenbachii]OBY66620.1 nucleotidyltransferase [Polaribacter reichenbachii]
MHNNLVILAGGMSSRMKKPSTSKSVNEQETSQANNRSKSLISVGNSGRPLMDYLLFNAKKAGYKNIYIVINEKGGLFKEFYGEKSKNNNFNGLNISFPIQYIPKDRVKPFGTADAVFQAVEQFQELQSQQFTVCNSDNLYSEKSLKILRETSNSNALVSFDRDALEFSLEKIYSFAIMNLDENNYLKNIIEKPSVEEAENYKDDEGKIRVSMNIFKMDGKMIYPYLKNCPIHPKRNEKELPTVVLNCVADYTEAFLAIPLSEHVPDLTAKDDIIIIKEYLKKHYPDTLTW